MEISEVLAEWDVFKEELQKELDDYNNRTGKYETSALLERAKALKEWRGIILDIHKLLAIGDLIESLADTKMNKMLDECAFERGWGKYVQDIKWENDKDKLISLSPLPGKKNADFSDYIPFDYVHYEKTGRMTMISSAVCPLIEIYKDNNQYKAKLTDDLLVKEYIRKIDWGLRR